MNRQAGTHDGVTVVMILKGALWPITVPVDAVQRK